jgi:protein-disulfide isomerase
MRASLGPVLLVAILTAWTAAPAAAQPITQQQADDILKELRAIRQALERISPPTPVAPAPAPKVKLNDVSGYVLGRPNAPVTVVEFTDLQCPFCNRFSTTTFKQIKAAYIDTGLVRFVTRDFPLDMHQSAEMAARASRCAGEQGKFWELRTLLVDNASRLSPDFILGSADTLKMDGKAFRQCLDSKRYQADIQKDLDDARSVGVEGTPTFVIGRTPGEGQPLDGVRIVGAQPFQVFEAKFKELLPAAPGK